MSMPGRTYTAGSSYRYGFNGKENDNEVKGTGNQQDYGMRIYDPRLARFLSVDPLEYEYPYYTPYQFAGNTPIWAVDIDGLEPAYATFSNNGTITGGMNVLPAGDNLQRKIPDSHLPEIRKQFHIDVATLDKDALSLGLDITPGVGTIKGGLEGIIGKDLLTGRGLSPLERGLGLIPYLSKAKKAIKVVKATQKVNDAGKAAKTINRTVKTANPEQFAEFIDKVDNLPIAAAIRSNRFIHIFDKAEHALGGLVKMFGSEQKAFNAVQEAANEALKSGILIPGKNGILPKVGEILDVGGMQVRLIGGKVEDGKVLISSFSRKGLK